VSLDQLNPARQAIARGDVPAARRLVARALIADPANEQGWLLMARLAGSREQVIECLERALRLNPANPATQSALQAVKRGRIASAADPASTGVLTPARPLYPSAPRTATQPVRMATQPLAFTPVEAAEPTIRPLKPKRNLSLIFGALIVLLVCLIALIGPYIAPQDPMEEHAIFQAAGKWYIPPFNAFQVPGFILGSDQFGRDMLSRILYAIRPTLVMISIVAFVRLVLGTMIGLGAGWSNNRFGRFLDGLISAALSVPILLVALGAITMLGTEGGLIVFIIGLSINGWGETARLVRQQTQLVKGQLFIESARSQGASSFQILSQHILRQIMPMIWMLFAFEISGTLMVTGALGFLGYYIGGDVWIEVADFVSRRTSGFPELGQMLATSWVNLLQPWPLVLTGSVVFLIILGFNLLGDGLRSRLNPVYINRASFVARLSQRFSLWFDESVSDPLSGWFRANRLRPVLASLALVILGGSIYFYQATISNRVNPSISAFSVPGGHIWASGRIDPYGTAYFNALGPVSVDLLWQMNHPAGFSGNPIVSSNGTLYLAGLDGVLYALSPDGSLLWKNSLPVNPLGPLALGLQGEIYITDSEGGLSAFSPDGNLLWTYSNKTFGKPNHGAIVASNGCIYYLLETPSGDTLVALSAAGQKLWSRQPGTYGADTGLRLSPDGTQIYVKNAVVNTRDGSIAQITLPTQDSPILANQARLFVGADGSSYLLAGHTVIQWKAGIQGFTVVQSASWDYRGQGMNQNSGFPVDAGVTPQGHIWLFYSGYYGGTTIYWLSKSGDILGEASGPFDQGTHLVAMDGNSTAYVCGNGFSSQQKRYATFCEAYRADETGSVWRYFFPRGVDGIVGASLAPGRIYVVTQDGTLTALGTQAGPAQKTSPSP
jgi:peptide/nickel transport system permease protein